MGAFRDLTGQKFGRLMVVSFTSQRNGGNVVWQCKCDCGNHVSVPGNRLIIGNTNSCGCLRKETASENGKKKVLDLSGKKFGRLTVIKKLDIQDKHRRVSWLCQCDCGEKVVRIGCCLKYNKTPSCGCYQTELNRKMAKNNIKNLKDKKFGRLKVIKRIGNKSPVKWLCQCDCGKKTVVAGGDLKRGKTISCGCLKMEKHINMLKVLQSNKKETKIEKIIRLELQKQELDFNQEFSIKGISLVDFYLPEYNLIIYCDGDYWHRLPGVRQRDYRINRQLRKLGYRVLRLWEKDINNNLNWCIEKLNDFIKEKYVSIK